MCDVQTRIYMGYNWSMNIHFDIRAWRICTLAHFSFIVISIYLRYLDAPK